MAETYVAKAAVVKVSIGPADGNRVARIIRVGGVIPEGVDPESLDALVDRGLIERVETVLVEPVIGVSDAAAVAAKAEAEADAKERAAADAAAAKAAKASDK